MKRTTWVGFAMTGVLLGLTGGMVRAEDGVARPDGYPDPSRFLDDIQAFAEADASAKPAPGGVLCTGSSSMRMWHPKLAEDLAPLDVIPRGFGGSTLFDVLHYLDPLVLAYRPRAVVIYEGDNDVNKGVRVDDLVAVFERLLDRLHQDLPDTRVYVLSIKPCPERWALWPTMAEANARLAERCGRDDRLTYLDVASPLLGEDGLPRPDLYEEDDVHLNRDGYLVWRDVLRPVLHAGELPVADDQSP